MFVTTLIAGLVLGGTYALVAMGLTLQYGISRIMNLAYGETIIAASFLAYALSGSFNINPLVSVLMGAVLLGERFTVPQIVALALATLAVLVLTIESGGIPWISLALAITFAVYGYLRKTLPIGPSQGFFLEVLLLSGPCLAYIVWIQLNGTGHFLPSKPVDFALLLACGPITATPLLLYAFGAKLLRLSTLGLMQYLAPTMVLMIAVFVFGEPFDMIHGIAFG
ncbi:MAG: hypothetical protein J0H75_04440, partial [Rhizobiales bacterium]|nr:hypothetical protein [Hyphomicrobiales bacterium]